ncbi:MAG: hypothetical protein GXP42_00220 [Chloroflexi bacterium]|nr:hypothetical protein [Chloroflexota bacterium]
MMGGMALGLFASSAQALPAAVQAFNHEDCRPDGMARTAGVDAPYCLAYDAEGRELMGGRTRRVIGYFTSWRNGSKGDPAYLVSDIPWERLTHINYAFAHIDDQGAISVGDVSDPNNPATGMEWPGVAGAEMDLTLPYKGHFNLLHQYKQQYPNVKVLISVGGWAETGGYFDAQGNRVNNGGFYTLTVNNDNTINTAAIDSFADSVVAFLRQYPFFDGVDIDYEYPTSMQDAGNPLDWGVANPRRAALMQGYVVLLKTLREKLDAAAAQDGKYYFLTIAAPSSGYLLRGMETYQATQYLDYVNIMSYDLHGAWNKYVGPNAALYDQGNDSELASWNVYNTAAYGGIGYLNTDWAYHYFRGSMPAGRINIGVPFYTRGWKNVTGGTNGLWGEAPGSNCPTGLTSCGDGAVGIDNLWHDVDENGQEIGAGSNPMWHAKNLEAGILPDYLADYGLDPAADPADQLTGVYQRFYDAGLVAPWLWNDAKNVFLSIEDEESLTVKAQYVVDKGIGGIMFWELAGDYAWHPNRNNGQGEYFMGDTLVTLIANAFDNAPPYGNRKNPDPIPAQSLDVSIALENFPIGDNNYPINPEFVITNHSNITLPAGAEVQFDYPTSAPSNMKDWSGVGVQVIASDHTAANNIGGLQGDFHRAAFTLPQDIPPGGSYRFELVYYLPISGPSNFSIAFGGQTYTLGADHYAAYVTGPTPTPTPLPTNTPTPAATSTPLPTATPTPTPAATNTPAPTASPTPGPTPAPTPAHEIVAYFTQWGIYGRQYFVKDIVANGAADKLTVINYAFGHIKDGECVMVTQTGVMDAYADYQKSFTAAQSVDGVADQWNQPLRGNFNQLKKLKAMYPNLKVLISLGGWTWSEGFSDAALTPESRARAAATCIDIYLRGNLPLQDGAGGPAAAFGVFDGIDIDWEYPAMPANDGHVYRPEDTQNFTLLLEEFRRQLDALEQETGREYLLTIAAPAGVDKYEKIELDKIHPYLDWINLMTYDMHGGWESATNHQAPIYHNPNDPSAYPASEYNIDNAVQAYLNAGVPAGKLLVGVPFYGRGWKGVPNVNNGLFQSATGAAPGTWEAGIEDYKVLKTKGYPLFRDDVAKAAWLYNGDEFWSFDDPVVIADKMAYVKALGLRGAMAWSLDGDDGTLMTAIYNGLN